ncbi:carbohydrate porin [Colwellia psychrerythraea]|jgi:hypothetical protein|uniref:Phosphate-selective porin O and P n=1 Tax=Colwellia psychrerythraea (strain 34H / ATCC BAA-681) TaxID=167879 RepID=Q47UH4_COLP3|nr:carbohydrate porin [Colwellia psychrerythraea]AAZ26670.1 hypothetical protein CPS_4910 [Colwellia psychrerythraea 34H]
MKIYNSVLLGCLLTSSTAVWADTSEQRIEQLEKKIAKLEKQDTEDQKKISSLTPDIKIGGAVRVNYNYSDSNKDRGGDLDFSLFRLDLNGTIGDIRLSAEYRWYTYMDVVHHAYAAYQFNENWEGQIGVTKVPFGNLDYNSNSFFFSDAFYAGLEDDYDAGLKFIGKFDNHDIRLAYFLNDEAGGSGTNARYSFDVVGLTDLDENGAIIDPFAAPTVGLSESNTINLRYTYTFDNDVVKTEVGGSFLTGELEGATDSLGDRTAYAVHLKSNMNNFTLMLQYTDYDYDLDNGDDFVTVGAYAYNDSMPTSATIYNINLAYSYDVDFGAFDNLTFYNDYTVMTDKSGNFKEDTQMNVFGVGVTAGPIFGWVDYVAGTNQPFNNGTLVGDSTEWEHQLNIQIGYYF